MIEPSNVRKNNTTELNDYDKKIINKFKAATHNLSEPSIDKRLLKKVKKDC